MSRTIRYLLLSAVVLILIAGAFSGGVVVGWFVPRDRDSSKAVSTVESESAVPLGTTNEALFAPFWQAWDLVHQQYVDQPVDDLSLMQGAIRGMVEALGDTHTSYMDPNEFIQMNQQLEGDYEGIGAYVDTSGEFLTITSPIPGSPAEAAGLKPGDQIIAVDGDDVTGIDGSLVLRRVLGPAGTEVTLSVRREGEDAPLDFVITRAEIHIAVVESEMLDNGIAYLNLTSYSDDSAAEVRSALKDLLAQNPRGLILDLRYNGGGFVQAAVEITSQFVDEGVILYEEFGDGTKTEYKAKTGGLALDIPMVVLVNEGTASASEITAGALQDFERATLVGVTTYGKGSVQIFTALEDEQGAVRITIAHWLTPDLRQIDKLGLEPDVVVELTEEDADAKRDPQLDKAVETLLEQTQ